MLLTVVRCRVSLWPDIPFFQPKLSIPTESQMRRIIQVAVLAIAAVGLVGTPAVQAGYATGYEVYVDASSGYAYGTLSKARLSSDSTQFIGCYIYAFATGTNVRCSARNKAGSNVSCVFPSNSNSSALAAASSIGPESDVSFSFNQDGYCSSLSVNNSSIFLR